MKLYLLAFVLIFSPILYWYTYYPYCFNFYTFGLIKDFGKIRNGISKEFENFKENCEILEFDHIIDTGTFENIKGYAPHSLSSIETRIAFDNIAVKRDLEVLEWFCGKYKPDLSPEDILRLCTDGKIPQLEYLQNRYQFSLEDILGSGIGQYMRRNVSGTKWLVEKFNLQKSDIMDINVIGRIFQLGKKEVLDYLKEKFDIIPEDIPKCVYCEFTSAETDEWLEEAYGILDIFLCTDLDREKCGTIWLY